MRRVDFVTIHNKKCTKSHLWIEKAVYFVKLISLLDCFKNNYSKIFLIINREACFSTDT